MPVKNDMQHAMCSMLSVRLSQSTHCGIHSTVLDLSLLTCLVSTRRLDHDEFTTAKPAEDSSTQYSL